MREWKYEKTIPTSRKLAIAGCRNVLLKYENFNPHLVSCGLREHWKFEQLKSKTPHPQKCIKILGKLENLQVFLFLFIQTKWWNKNLEIIYEENPISENPKPRKIKTIYNLILKKINVGNKLRI